VPRFKFKTVELKAESRWPVDTSVGFEQWTAGGHKAIVFTNGCLGVINKSRPGTNEFYKDVQGWEKIKKLPHVFKLVWKARRVELYVDGKLRASYEGALTPQEPLNVRLNASNDFADQLKVGYISVK